ncbi:D-alanyl-D-alanine carboxypeptidase [Streptomyces aurantiacus]|uniref:serine hydrolase domain-containing protein n=1 Tax=Streptomyces aurantiacus TaxID=47760 RepID=UPI00278CB783|nr:serine hydrolase domain-containing protein [Streptomyces aurantiacus]MDQ0779904.1 D-alanyl-D-alanine carboxypeptidase [Streptomyces aurantiacus]
MTPKTSTRTVSRVAVATLVVSLAAAAGCSTDAPKGSTSSAMGARNASNAGGLQDSVNAILKAGSVGVVAQSTDPRGSRYATAGKADRQTGDAVRRDDRFRMGSTTKPFVATVVLQLVREGQLSLDDTVEHWLPGVVSGNGNDGGKITVRQLLQHTSGLFDYLNDFPEIASVEGYQADRYVVRTPEELVAIAMRHKPGFRSGTKWGYSNTNYVLAGMIIEKATGKSWEEEVTQRIIRPLHLRDTSAPTTETHISGHHMRGYSSFGGPGKAIDVTEYSPTAADAAGSMIGTAADVNTFFSALMDGELLRPTQLNEMEKTVRAPLLDALEPGAGYGLGLAKVPLTCGGVYYSHGGDLPGYTTRNGVSADGRHAVAVQATGEGSANPAIEKALATLIDREFCASGRR